MARIKTDEISNLAKDIEEDIVNKVNNFEFNQEILKKRKGISTGVTVLNLALSDRYDIGYKLGTVVNIVGDWSSGKTFLLWTMFGEALRNTSFDNYRFVYDEPEFAFDINPRLFGPNTDRIRRDIKSTLITDVHSNILKEMQIGKILYGLDSFDAIKTKEELEREKKLLKEKKPKKTVAYDEDSDEEIIIEEEITDKKEKGTYSLEKQKYSRILFRSLVESISTTDSLLIVVSQTSQKIGVMFGEKKTRAGGDALHFYSTHEIWLSIKERLRINKKTVGVKILAKIKKNKVTGKERLVEFPIYYDYGINNIESMIDFLLIENCWKKERGIINTCGDLLNIDNEKLNKDAMIKYIDDNNLEESLSKIVQDHWYKIEDALKTNLKPRY